MTLEDICTALGAAKCFNDVGLVTVFGLLMLENGEWADVYLRVPMETKGRVTRK